MATRTHPAVGARARDVNTALQDALLRRAALSTRYENATERALRGKLAAATRHILTLVRDSHLLSGERLGFGLVDGGRQVRLQSLLRSIALILGHYVADSVLQVRDDLKAKVALDLQELPHVVNTTLRAQSPKVKLQEASGDDACTWRTINGHPVCITPGHGSHEPSVSVVVTPHAEVSIVTADTPHLHLRAEYDAEAPQSIYVAWLKNRTTEDDDAKAKEPAQRREMGALLRTLAATVRERWPAVQVLTANVVNDRLAKVLRRLGAETQDIGGGVTAVSLPLKALFQEALLTEAIEAAFSEVAAGAVTRQEAIGGEDCRWVTIRGNPVCIMGGHTHEHADTGGTAKAAISAGLQAAGMPPGTTIPEQDMSLATLFTRGAFHITATPETGRYLHPGERYSLRIEPKQTEGIFPLPVPESDRLALSKDTFYDSRIATPAADAESGYGRATVRPDSGYVATLPAQKEPGYIWRGMSFEEYQRAVKLGHLESTGGYNLGKDQADLTYFADDPQTAESYASSFQPYSLTATFGYPAYMVKIKEPKDSVRLPHIGENEVGVKGRIPLAAVEQVIELRPYEIKAGELELNQSRYVARPNLYTAGSGRHLRSRVAYRVLGHPLQEAAADIDPEDRDWELPLFRSVPVTQVTELLGTPLGGAFFQQSFADLAATLLASVRNVLLWGLTTGQGVQPVARKLQGVLGNSRWQAERIVRSEFIRAANQAALTTFAQNEDVLDGVQWVATLDDRTCLQCGVLDGRTWENLTAAPVPVTDTHPQCRCTLVPLVKDAEDLGLPPASRASFSGQVPATLTYDDWFGQQDADFQRDVLGPRRFALYQSDRASLGDFATASGVRRVRDVLADFEEAGFAEVAAYSATIQQETTGGGDDCKWITKNGFRICIQPGHARHRDEDETAGDRARTPTTSDPPKGYIRLYRGINPTRNEIARADATHGTWFTNSYWEAVSYANWDYEGTGELGPGRAVVAVDVPFEDAVQFGRSGSRRQFSKRELLDPDGSVEMLVDREVALKAALWEGDHEQALLGMPKGWGGGRVRQEALFQEFNPYHLPAGSPAGGQFTSGPGGGGGGGGTATRPPTPPPLRPGAGVQVPLPGIVGWQPRQESDQARQAWLDQERQGALQAMDRIFEEINGTEVEIEGPTTWDELDDDAKSEIQNQWENDHYDEFYQKAEEAWRESLDIGSEVQSQMDDDTAWQEETFRAALAEHGDLTDEQVAEVVEKISGRDELRYALQAPASLPDGLLDADVVGAEIADHLALRSGDIRQALTRAVKAEYDARVESYEEDLEVPDSVKDEALDAVSEAFSNLDPSERDQLAADYGPGSSKEIVAEPDRWLLELDPNSSSSFSRADREAYQMTGAIAKAMLARRAEELWRERFPNPMPGSEAPDFEEVGRTFWNAWKKDSFSLETLGMHGALVGELAANTRLREFDAAARHGLTPEEVVDRITDSQRVYARALWETTQFLLAKSGTSELDLYRSVIMKPEDVRKHVVTVQDPTGGPGHTFEKLPTLPLQQNPAQSFTHSERVANTWDGVGSSPAGGDRVIVRARVPATAIWSLPVYGKNIHHERETVVLGTPWVKWDAWRERVPSFRSIMLEWLMQEDRRAYGLSVITQDGGPPKPGVPVIDFSDPAQTGGQHWLWHGRFRAEQQEAKGDGCTWRTIPGRGPICIKPGHGEHARRENARIARSEVDLRGHAVEHLQVFTPDGLMLLDKIGTESQVTIPPEAMDRLAGGVIVHNHPGGRSFSPDDIRLLLDTGAVSIRAVGHDRVFQMDNLQPGRRDGWAEIMAAVREADAAIHRDYTAKLNARTMTLDEANATHHDAVWREVTTRFPGLLRYSVRPFKPEPKTLAAGHPVGSEPAPGAIVLDRDLDAPIYTLGPDGQVVVRPMALTEAWDEAEHPRDDRGRFTDAGGDASSAPPAEADFATTQALTGHLPAAARFLTDQGWRHVSASPTAEGATQSIVYRDPETGDTLTVFASGRWRHTFADGRTKDGRRLLGLKLHVFTQAFRGPFIGAPSAQLEAAEEACRWITYQGRRICITPRHTHDVEPVRFATSLGIERKAMPQIRAKDMAEFLSYVSDQGVRITRETVPASSLRPAQAHYNPQQVAQMQPENMGKPLVVSREGYILDGTHRWVRFTQIDPEATVTVLRIDRPATEAIALMKRFPKAEAQDIGDIGAPRGRRLRLAAVRQEYREDQPREPKGSPTGGQWTGGGGSAPAAAPTLPKRTSVPVSTFRTQQEAADDCHWITKNGAHICITAGHGEHSESDTLWRAWARDSSAIDQGLRIALTGGQIPAGDEGYNAKRQLQRLATLLRTDVAHVPERLAALVADQQAAIRQAGIGPTVLLYRGVGESEAEDFAKASGVTSWTDDFAVAKSYADLWSEGDAEREPRVYRLRVPIEAVIASPHGSPFLQREREWLVRTTKRGVPTSRPVEAGPLPRDAGLTEAADDCHWITYQGRRICIGGERHGRHGADETPTRRRVLWGNATAEERGAFARDLADKYGVSHAQVVLNEGNGPTRRVGADSFSEAGHYDPSNRSIVLFADHLSTDEIDAMMAHESGHAAWHVFKDEAERERKQIQDYVKEGPDNPKVHSWGSVTRREREVFVDPIASDLLQGTMQARWPARYAMSNFMESFNERRAALMAWGAAVSPYAALWWRNFETNQATLEQAVNETLAEMRLHSPRLRSRVVGGGTVTQDPDAEQAWTDIFRAVNAVNARMRSHG